MPGRMQIAYALTSDGRDTHADMALVSMLSARLTNPGVRLRVLADADSAEALRASRHRVLEVCDELRAVATPDGSPVFKNRWIKTQAAEFVDEACLLLDCDTIVSRSLAEAWPRITDLGAVANHNAPDLQHQVWREDLEFLRRMSWPANFSFYANGGALFFRPTPAVREFFRHWHQLWRQGAAESGRLRDQPALSTALHQSRVQATELPPSFNCQTYSVFASPDDATAIWHFYGSVDQNTHGHYTRLLSLSRQESIPELRRRIRTAIDCRILGPKPVRHGIRFKPAGAASLEAARGKKIALLLSMEFEGLYRNGGIGTYYRELSQIFHQRGWFTVLLNLSHYPTPEAMPPLPGLDCVFQVAEFEKFMELNQANRRLLECSQHSNLDRIGTQSLLFIQAVANTFPGQNIYAEFHEMCGPGYHAAKARESGWLAPDVVVGVTMHSGHEWIFEANDAILSQDSTDFLNVAAREEDSFRSADLAMFPSESLHQIVGSYGWRTEHAAKLPYSIPLSSPTPSRAPRPRRKMTIYCGGGLANRLGTLAAGYWLARFFGLKPAIWWPREPHCECPLVRLLLPPADVEVTDVSPWEAEQRKFLEPQTIVSHLPIHDLPQTSPKLLADREHLQRLMEENHRPVLYHDNWLPPWLDPAAPLRLFEREFALDEGIAREVRDFAFTHQLARRAAVHLRLTDFGVGEDHYLPAVREAIARHPDEPIFLCSDSEEAEEHYLRTFPRLFVRAKRAFVTKRAPSLPWLDPSKPFDSDQRYNVRRNEAAVIEGMHDLCLLATAADAYTVQHPNTATSSFFKFARLWNPGVGSLPDSTPSQVMSDRDLFDERHFRFPTA
jgi:hypothetical protein